MADNSDQLLHFHEYFKIIRNRLWVIFTIFALTVLSGYYVTNYVQPKVYTTSSLVLINAANLQALPGMISGKTEGDITQMQFQSEFEIMQSPDVLKPIITELQLDKVWAKRVFKSTLDQLPMQDAMGYMTHILHLDYKRGTNIIEVTVSSEVPKECAEIANAVAERYKAKKDIEAETKQNQGVDALREQIAELTKAVNSDSEKVKQLRQDLGDKGVDITNGVGEGTNVVERLEAELDQRKHDKLTAEEDYDARRVLLTKVIDLPNDKFIATLKGLSRSQPDIDELNSEILKDESDMQNLLNDGFDSNHPRIISLKAERDSRQDQVNKLIDGLRRAMAVDVDMAKSRVELLETQVETLQKRYLDDTTSLLVPYSEAKRKLGSDQGMLDSLNVRLQGNIADISLQQSSVKIISRAEPPEYPSLPKKSLNYMISVALGLFVGIGVAFLIEYLDTSVKTMADAETLLGLPVLTVIPNKGGPMPLIQDTGRLPHAEGYRILRAKLDLKVQNGIGPALTMLSGGPGEGKSTTIYNLAVVCAQAGQSVILVDCDLRRPTLHELVNVSNERGLSNYLRGEGEATAFVQRTAIPKLHVLTAGNMPMSDIGVLAGDKIRHMLDDLKQRYDLVLIDAPPVLGISDGSIIAREVEYVILVIQHRRYPREISLRAKRAIEEVHGNCVGMVLNCVAVKSDDSYYYYSSYGNYYKKGTGKKKKDKPAEANGKHATVSTRQGNLDSEEF